MIDQTKYDIFPEDETDNSSGTKVLNDKDVVENKKTNFTIKIPPWLTEILAGLGIVAFVIVWFKIGPGLLADIFFPTARGALWLNIMSDIGGAIVGTVGYYVFLSSIKPKNGTIIFTLSMIFLLLMHITMVSISHVQIASHARVAESDVIVLKKGLHKIVVRKGELTDGYYDTDGDIVRMESPNKNFILIKADNNPLSPWEIKKWQKEDFLFKIQSFADQEIIIQVK